MFPLNDTSRIEKQTELQRAVSVMRVPLAGATVGDRMGCSATVLGDLAIVGACTADVSGHQVAGRLHTFRASTATPTGVVIAPTPTAGARFGTAIAVAKDDNNSDGLLLASAIGEDSDRGCAYLFRFPLSAATAAAAATAAELFPAQFARRFVAPGFGTVDAHFGSALALHSRSSIAVIGARGPGADASATPAPGATADDTSGVVFIFDTSTGAMLLKLQPSDAHGSHLPSCLFFGAALAISDRVVVVGAPRARPPCVPSGGMLSGAVFVFGTSEAGVLSNATAASFNQTARLVPPESALEGGLEFGSSVGIVTTVWRTTSLPRSLLAVGAFLMHTLLTHNTHAHGV